MSNSIERYNFEDKILFLYFRHRGNISKIIEGLSKLPGYQDTNIDPDYISKIVLKFKKQRKNDWGKNICYTFMEHMHMGVQERLCRYQEWLDKLKDAEEVYVSACHEAPVLEHTNKDGVIEYRCTHTECGQICQRKRLQKMGIYNLQMKILKEMRKDEDHLLSALKALGFSVAEPANINKTTNFNVIVEDTKRVHQVDGDKKLLGQIDEMDPRSREKLIKNLEHDIITTEFENKEKNKNTGKD